MKLATFFLFFMVGISIAQKNASDPTKTMLDFCSKASYSPTVSDLSAEYGYLGGDDAKTLVLNTDSTFVETDYSDVVAWETPAPRYAGTYQICADTLFLHFKYFRNHPQFSKWFTKATLRNDLREMNKSYSVYLFKKLYDSIYLVPSWDVSTFARSVFLPYQMPYTVIEHNRRYGLEVLMKVLEVPSTNK